MTFLFHSVIFSIITIHMLNTGKILPENILTFTQDARKEKIYCSSGQRDVHLGSLGRGMISGFTRRWGLVVKSSRVVGSGQGLLFSMLLRRDITVIPGIVGTNRSHQLIAISTSRWSQCRLWSPMVMAGMPFVVAYDDGKYYWWYL